MSKEALPTRALNALAERLGITDPRLISDVKTNRVGETHYISVVLTQEISQTELQGLVR